MVIFFFFSFIYISWRLITLHYCSGFCHTLIWISHGFTCAPHLNSPPTSFPIPSLWVILVHQPWTLVSCIKCELVICFTIDNIHVSMLFSQIIPHIAFSFDPLFCVPELGRSPGEGNGYPLQYSCLENPMDRGAWRAAVHGVAKGWAQLSN